MVVMLLQPLSQPVALTPAPALHPHPPHCTPPHRHAPNSSSSTDLVHWKDLGRGVHRTHETYEGMDSNDVPCSGFVTVDDGGTPCAGLRQCGSGKGTTGAPTSTSFGNISGGCLGSVPPHARRVLGST